MSEPLIIGYEDTPQGRDAVALGRTLGRVAGARPLLAAVFTWPQGVMTDEPDKKKCEEKGGSVVTDNVTVNVSSSGPVVLTRVVEAGPNVLIFDPTGREDLAGVAGANSKTAVIDPPKPGGTPDTCSYYNNRCKQGDTYSCNASQCCRDFGNSPKINATRECLMTYDFIWCANGDVVCRTKEHFDCYLVNGRIPWVNIPVPSSCMKTFFSH